MLEGAPPVLVINKILKLARLSLYGAPTRESSVSRKVANFDPKVKEYADPQKGSRLSKNEFYNRIRCKAPCNDNIYLPT